MTVRIAPTDLAEFDSCARKHFYRRSFPHLRMVEPLGEEAHRLLCAMLNYQLADQPIDFPVPAGLLASFRQRIVPDVQMLCRQGVRVMTEATLTLPLHGDLIAEAWEGETILLSARADVAFMDAEGPLAIFDYKFFSSTTAVERFSQMLPASPQFMVYRSMLASSATEQAERRLVYYLFVGDPAGDLTIERRTYTFAPGDMPLVWLQQTVGNYLQQWVVRRQISAKPRSDGVCVRCEFSEICEYPSRASSASSAYDDLILSEADREEGVIIDWPTFSP